MELGLALAQELGTCLVLSGWLACFSDSLGWMVGCTPLMMRYGRSTQWIQLVLDWMLCFHDLALTRR